MSRGLWRALAASGLLLLGSTGIARADVAYSYEMDNADARADKVLVVWPRACSATGEPLGTVDLKLNPDWSSRMRDIDYEVVVRGKKHVLLEHCAKSSRLYALPVAEFARGSRDSTVDDMSIGQMETGGAVRHPPLARRGVASRSASSFFGKDARVLRTTFRFEPSKASRPAALEAVHEVLEVDAFDATSFAVKTKRAIYTHADGHLETVEGPAGWTASAAADASAPAAPAAAPAAPAAPAPPNLGTRWVLLAAVASLVMTVVILVFRKKRDAAK